MTILDRLLFWRQRSTEDVGRELVELIEETQREIRRREVVGRLAERTARKVRAGAPPCSVLREIGRLQRLIRDEPKEDS